MFDSRNIDRRTALLILLAAFILSGCVHRARTQCCAKSSGGQETINLRGFQLVADRAFGSWKKVYCNDSSTPRSKPAIVILHELPGLTEECLDLGYRLGTNGYTVYIPLLFGKAGDDGWFWNRIKLIPDPNWKLMNGNKTSPIVGRLRNLCYEISERHSPHKIGVIGNCLTGSFPLALLNDTNITAAVLSQPTLPLPLLFPGQQSVKKKRSLGLSPSDIHAAKKRCDSDNLDILGFRFCRDKISPPEKFQTLKKIFGNHFRDGTITNACMPDTDHAVLTGSYVGNEGHPTKKRYDEMVEYFNRQLKSAN